jgi:cytoskeletal protein RodZ
MFSVGETLRRARQERGLDLFTVAAQTKISARYLEAIESDDRKILPGGFFYKSFVDQYAKWLALDPREIDAEVDRLISAPLPLPGIENIVARNVPPMRSARRLRSFGSYVPAISFVLVLAGCSGVYAWWHGGRASFHMSGVMDGVRAFVKPSAPQIAHAQSVPARAPEPPKSSPVKALPVALESTLAPVKSQDKPLETPAPAGSHRVSLDLFAREATWLSVSSDGKPVFSGTLQANETKSVRGKEFAKLRVGNAAGLEVRLNGKLLGPLGARGQVLTVLFRPDNFEIVATPKESD